MPIYILEIAQLCAGTWYENDRGVCQVYHGKTPIYLAPRRGKYHSAYAFEANDIEEAKQKALEALTSPTDPK